MKIHITISIVLITNILLAQRGNTIFAIDGNNLFDVEYDDFIENDISAVESYTYQINENGNVKPDSTRLYAQILSDEQDRISGINCKINYQSNGSPILTYYKFEKLYNSDGLIIKRLKEPLTHNRRKEFGLIFYEKERFEEHYTYSEEGRLSKKVSLKIEDDISISKWPKDTLQLSSIKPRIYEYYYDEMGREIENYYLSDSTTLIEKISDKPDSTTVNCFSCDPKHLNNKKEYGVNGKISKWTTYTRDGDYHTIRYYYYDDQNRLKQRVDSTGWHYNEYPFLDKTIEYNYTDSMVWTVIEKNGSSLRTTKYNKDGKIVKECYESENIELNCESYEYEFQNDKLYKVTITSSNNDKILIKNNYNEYGLLSDIRKYVNQRLISLVKYKYWRDY